MRIGVVLTREGDERDEIDVLHVRLLRGNKVFIKSALTSSSLRGHVRVCALRRLSWYRLDSRGVGVCRGQKLLRKSVLRWPNSARTPLKVRVFNGCAPCK